MAGAVIPGFVFLSTVFLIRVKMGGYAFFVIS
jgi:hypothetical protein